MESPLHTYMREMHGKVIKFCEASNELYNCCADQMNKIYKDIWEKDYVLRQQISNLKQVQKAINKSKRFSEKQKKAINKIFDKPQICKSNPPPQFCFVASPLKITPSLFGYPDPEVLKRKRKQNVICQKAVRSTEHDTITSHSTTSALESTAQNVNIASNFAVGRPHGYSQSTSQENILVFDSTLTKMSENINHSVAAAINFTTSALAQQISNVVLLAAINQGNLRNEPEGQREMASHEHPITSSDCLTEEFAPNAVEQTEMPSFFVGQLQTQNNVDSSSEQNNGESSSEQNNVESSSEHNNGESSSKQNTGESSSAQIDLNNMFTSMPEYESDLDFLQDILKCIEQNEPSCASGDQEVTEETDDDDDDMDADASAPRVFNIHG